MTSSLITVAAEHRHGSGKMLIVHAHLHQHASSSWKGSCDRMFSHMHHRTLQDTLNMVVAPSLRRRHPAAVQVTRPHGYPFEVLPMQGEVFMKAEPGGDTFAAWEVSQIIGDGAAVVGNVFIMLIPASQEALER